jgi:HAD superfamily hydrolase (TIGR01509 family)
MDILLERSGLIQFFDFYLSSDDVKEPKPNPEIYLSAFTKLNMNPNECLILEDNENGIKAAQASGAHLLIINDIQDVTLENIVERIYQIEAQP